MGLIELVILLVVVGVCLWAINAYIPMEPRIKQLLNVVVIIVLVVWLLKLLLGAGDIPNPRIG